MTSVVAKIFISVYIFLQEALNRGLNMLGSLRVFNDNPNKPGCSAGRKTKEFNISTICFCSS